MTRKQSRVPFACESSLASRHQAYCWLYRQEYLPVACAKGNRLVVALTRQVFARQNEYAKNVEWVFAGFSKQGARAIVSSGSLAIRIPS